MLTPTSSGATTNDETPTNYQFPSAIVERKQTINGRPIEILAPNQRKRQVEKELAEAEEAVTLLSKKVEQNRKIIRNETKTLEKEIKASRKSLCSFISNTLALIWSSCRRHQD
ncbi:MAG: hypothetical protein JWO53_632 [Chlamydiia bacterium]|nr:hypothetical protein [Chlamydiia bacterium]